MAVVSLDEPVADFAWPLNPDDAGMTLRHLCNMVSSYGYGADSPGEAFAYGNSGAGLLSELLTNVAGGDIDNVAVPLFSSLQLEDTPADLFSRHTDGRIQFVTTPRDFARIGWMLANRGNWNGAQVIASSFFAPLAQFGTLGNLFGHIQVPVSVPRSVAAFSPGDYFGVSGFPVPPENETAFGPGTFGLGWYFNGLNPGAVSQWPDLPADTMVTTGNFGGQVIILVPSEGLVVCCRASTADGSLVTGEVDTPASVDPQFNNTVKLLIDGITGAGLTPTFPGTSWTAITDAQAEISTAALDAFIAAVDNEPTATGCITRNGYMVRTWGDQTTPVHWGSSRKAMYAVLVGALAAAHEADVSWQSVVTDDFTGTDGNPPNPALWSVVDTGSGSVTIQGNALDMVGDGVDAASREVGLVAIMTAVDGLRIDADVVIPASPDVFFHTYHVRHATNGDHYYVMVARTSSGADPIVRVAKSLSGTNTTLSAADFTLSNSILHYRVRAWINGFTIRGAVRDFASGPIPEGAFDIQAVDGAESIPGVGFAQINMTAPLGGGTRTVTVDNIRVSKFVQPLWSPVLSDEYTGANNDPWDGAKWATYGIGGVADIQSNQGRLLADRQSTDRTTRASAILAAPLADIRIEHELTIPATGANGVFFDNTDLRIVHTTSEPTPDEDGYRIQIQRSSVSGTPSWSIRRRVSGVDSPLTSQFDLTNAELHYRIRFEVVGSVIRAVVRQFSAGPITEGIWDAEVPDSQITQAGTARISHTVGQSSGDDNEVFIDNVVISELLTQTSVAPIFLHHARMRAAA